MAYENLVTCGLIMRFDLNWVRGFRGFVWMGVMAAAVCVQAQQTVPVPQTDPKALPRQNAQVHTGSALGGDAATRMRSLLADHEYFKMADQLDQLPPEQAQ